MKIFVDTNIIIDFTKGYTKVLKTLFEKKIKGELELYINPIIVAEFLNDQSLKNKKTKTKALEFLMFFEILPITKETGIIASNLLREDKVSFLADAFISASCLQHKLLLATNNKKDFQKIKELDFYQST
jgi:predicted nucleic acid-binding protein